MKIETERERGINSALKEFELGSKEVKALILIRVQRFAEDPEVFPQLEAEVTRKTSEFAGYIVAGLLAQDSAEGSSMEEVAEVRRESRDQGYPLKVPMRA